MTSKAVDCMCESVKPMSEKAVIEMLQLESLQDDCLRFSRQVDALSSLYLDAITREHDHIYAIKDLKRERERLHRTIASVVHILFDEGKVRMSKEVEKRLREILF